MVLSNYEISACMEVSKRQIGLSGMTQGGGRNDEVGEWEFWNAEGK